MKKEFSPRYGIMIAVIGFLMAFFGYFRGELLLCSEML